MMKLKEAESGKRYRNSLDSFYKFFNNIHPKINERHILALKKTPFYSFVRVFIDKKITRDDLTKSANNVDLLIETFSEESETFIIGKKHLKLTAEEISMIFGLPNSGTIKTLPQYTKRSSLSHDCNKFVEKYFGRPKRIKKGGIEEAILSALEGGEECFDDIARLIVAHLIATFFFSNPQSYVTWGFLEHIVDFGKMSSTCWPMLIHTHLMNHIKLYMGKPRSNSACVTLLMYWICERVQLISPKETYQASYPKFAKWCLKELTNVFIPSKLQEIEDWKVIGEINFHIGATSNEEEDRSEQEKETFEEFEVLVGKSHQKSSLEIELAEVKKENEILKMKFDDERKKHKGKRVNLHEELLKLKAENQSLKTEIAIHGYVAHQKQMLLRSDNRSLEWSCYNSTRNNTPRLEKNIKVIVFVLKILGYKMKNSNKSKREELPITLPWRFNLIWLTKMLSGLLKRNTWSRTCNNLLPSSYPT